MNSEDEVLDVCAAVIVAAGVEERTRERTVWSENWLMKRYSHWSRQLRIILQGFENATSALSQSKQLDPPQPPQSVQNS